MKIYTIYIRPVRLKWIKDCSKKKKKIISPFIKKKYTIKQNFKAKLLNTPSFEKYKFHFIIYFSHKECQPHLSFPRDNPQYILPTNLFSTYPQFFETRSPHFTSNRSYTPLPLSTTQPSKQTKLSITRSQSSSNRLHTHTWTSSRPYTSKPHDAHAKRERESRILETLKKSPSNF